MELKSLLAPAMGLCWRIVATQEIAATRSITKSAAEQHRLEELLETVKPEIPADCRGLSYLLMTPFRYPPLKYGSRFGSPMTRGIFYGSVDLPTGFAETAVYFWLFQSGPLDMGPLATIRTQHTAFAVKLSSQSALDLANEYFSEHMDKIRDPASWQYTQTLGTELRACGAEFFWYPSARSATGKNIAVLSPKAFVTNEPEQQLHWHSQLSYTSCWFGRTGSTSIEFVRSQFERNGVIPHPAL